MSQKSNNLAHLWETPVSTELIYDGEVVHLYKDISTLPTGEPAMREYIRHIGAICVLPMTAEGEVICVRQYRYAHRCVLTEIPAGKLDAPDEDHVEAALRELREETGAHCKTLTHLGLFRSTPAILDEKIDLYLAEGLTFGDTDPDEDEFLETVRIPLATLVDQVMCGEITDGKTQVAVLQVNELLRRRNTQSRRNAP